MFDWSDLACRVAYEKLAKILPESIGEFDESIIYEVELKVVEIYVELSMENKGLINYFEVEMEIYQYLSDYYYTTEYEDRIINDAEFRSLKEKDRNELLTEEFGDYYSYGYGQTEEAIRVVLDKYKFCYWDDDCEEIIENNPQNFLFNFEAMTKYGGQV